MNKLLTAVIFPIFYNTNPPPPHTCDCQRCIQMTGDFTLGQITSIFVLTIGIMLIIVAGLFLWGWLFKKFGIW